MARCSRITTASTQPGPETFRNGYAKGLVAGINWTHWPLDLDLKRYTFAPCVFSCCAVAPSSVPLAGWRSLRRRASLVPLLCHVPITSRGAPCMDDRGSGAPRQAKWASKMSTYRLSRYFDAFMDGDQESYSSLGRPECCVVMLVEACFGRSRWAFSGRRAVWLQFAHPGG